MAETALDIDKLQAEIDKEVARLESAQRAREEAVTEIPVLVETKTRDFIARTVVQIFFALLAVILIGVPLYNAYVADDLRLDLPDLLQQYAAILGPVLGFVIGYYFKTKND